jgi:endonuclease-3
LADAYPGTARDLCELDHGNPFELLVATILSAQCTDKKVNEVTPALFARYPDAIALAAAEEVDVQELIRPTGFYQAKTRSLLGMASALVERFDGEVPPRMEDLVTLPGVGRKTANVILSVAFERPGLPVDTHVLRLTTRLGITDEDDAGKVEAILNKMIPPAERGLFSLRLILHGRRVCAAKKPDCPACTLNDFCPASTLRARRR